MKFKGGDTLANSDKQTDLIAYVDGLYDKAQQSRWMYLAQWLLNLHFYVGNQWVTWDQARLKWDVLPNLEGEIRMVQNKILPASRMLIGRMLKDQQIQQVIQAHNDESAIDAAKVATKWLEYVWRITEGDDIKQEVCTWGAITGIGITKTYVDPDKGPKKKASGKNDGDICVDVLSPFEFVQPPVTRSMKRLPWAMHARMETIEWVWNNYGIEVQPTGDWDNWAIYQAQIQDISTEGAFFGSRTQFEHDMVLVKELWIRPCKKYPKGRVIISAGNTLLHDDDIPYDKEYWPFNWLEFFKMPFRFYPMGVVEPMIDTQKAINEMSSDILENIRYMGKPIVSIPQGSMDPDTAVAEAGAFWEWNPAMGHAPAFVTPNPVSPEVFNEKSLLENHIYDTAGIHMLAGGMGGMRSAAAAMLMEQQDDTEFKAVSQNLESWLKRDAELKLFLAQKAFTTGRMIQIVGEEGQWEVVEFKASDLCGDEQVSIVAKQEFANDKMTKFNQILQLAQMRDENNQPFIDRQATLRMLDIADLGSIMTDFDLDMNKAMWENEQMDDGKEVTVHDFDDHATHIKFHNQRRKRIEFQSLPKHIQDLHTQHVLDHQNMMQKESAQQQVAKGDQVTTGMPPQAPQMPQQQQMPGMPQLPSIGNYNGAEALQMGVNSVHNQLGKAGV